jgi:hypothetical protein
MDFREGMVASREFNLLLGLFYGAWTSADMTIDLAIGRFLGLSDYEAQILTSGMEFGPKARLLYEVVKRSVHPKKAEILHGLNKLRNEAKRNILAHSYLIAGRESVTFLERSRGGDYIVKKHRFTYLQWQKDVTETLQAGEEFWKALGYTREELVTFAQAALGMAKN